MKKKGLTPSLDWMLSFKWWEVHEAAYILSGSWPENIVFRATLWNVNQQLNRGGIYIPDKRLNQKMLNCKTKILLSELIKSIENGDLNGLPRNLQLHDIYGKNVSYFVDSREVILWALVEGYILAEEIQQSITVYQLKNLKLNKSTPNQVKSQIVGQYLLAKNPSMSVTDLCKHEWMTSCGAALNYGDKERKAIRRALKKLYDSQGNKKCDRFYTLKPISMVVHRDIVGINRYSVPLLKVMLATAVSIKVETLGYDVFFKMNEQQFLQALFTDEIVCLYLNGASKGILELTTKFCLEELRERYSHPKLRLLSEEVLKNLSIGELYELNKEFCFESFTRDERLVFDKISKAKERGEEVKLTEEDKEIFKERKIGEIAFSEFSFF